VKGLAYGPAEDYPEAECSLRSSIEWARLQSAALFDLQAAMDLAELFAQTGARAGSLRTSQRRLIQCRPELRPRSRMGPAILNQLQSGTKVAG
jgi:hypothetical protein